MNILIIADPIVPVPPVDYGGAERIVAMYAQEFSRLGHRIHLLAAPGSRSFGGRLHLHHPPTKALISRGYRKIRFQAQSLWAARNCHVIYSNGRSDYLDTLLAERKPLLHCFHNPIDQDQIDRLESRAHARMAIHCLSQHQRSQAAVSAPSFVIPNPIDTNNYAPGSGEGSYLAYLGRLSPNKGVDVAIAAAKLSGKRLVIAGNLPPLELEQSFFQTQIEPHLDGDRIRWIGPVNNRQKQELLSQAAGLLFPVRAPEAFGLVMLEALACGCPVIATNRCAAPEIIDHGNTGFLCDPEEPSPEAFAQAISLLPQLDRVACRRAAVERFDLRVLAPRVLQLLEQLANGPIR